MKSDVGGVLVAAGGAGDTKLLPVSADDLQSCRCRIDDQRGPRSQRVRDRLTARDLCLGESGDGPSEESDARGAADSSHNVTYAGRVRLVPNTLTDGN